MDSRIIMLIMSVATFLAYPFLSGDGRKQVAPLAAQMDEPEEETDDEDQPVMMEDDEPSDDGMENDHQMDDEQ